MEVTEMDKTNKYEKEINFNLSKDELRKIADDLIKRGTLDYLLKQQ